MTAKLNLFQAEKYRVIIRDAGDSIRITLRIKYSQASKANIFKFIYTMCL